MRGEAFDFRAAGVGEAEEAGDLVESLAGGVVDGSADDRVVADAADMDEEGVSAGNDEGEVWRRWGVGIEEGGEEVALHVIDGEEGFAGGEGEGLGHGVADEEGGGEAGATGGGEGVDLIDAEVGGGEGLLDEGMEAEGVISRGDFRDDATVGAV